LQFANGLPLLQHQHK